MSNFLTPVVYLIGSGVFSSETGHKIEDQKNTDKTSSPKERNQSSDLKPRIIKRRKNEIAVAPAAMETST